MMQVRFLPSLPDKGLKMNEDKLTSEAELVCAEAYVIVGALFDKLEMFDTDIANKVLDNLSEARLVHKDILPFVLPD
jgi:hypothetical protein